MNPKIITKTQPLQARNGFVGIYVHYPYCYQKCDYCDFYSEGIGKSPSENESLLFETYKKEFRYRIKDSNQLKSNTLDTIFFGGGTPSKASPKHWKELIQFFKNELPFSQDIEISLEANPEDLSSEFIDELFDAGINRLNVGVQTRNAQGLSFLGRHVDEEKFNNLTSIFSTSKIQRLGIDLMYGLPDLTISDFLSDLDFFTGLGLAHLSLYSLTLEKGTAYSRKVKEKLLTVPDEEIQREILELLPTKLREKGYIWYEVSNYCLPDQFSRHNLRYWTREPYLGLGPGAHGFLDENRYGNPRNTLVYLKNHKKAILEPASPKIELILSLFRLFIPLSLGTFCDLHLNKQETDDLKFKISQLAENGFCYWDGSTFQWKPSALLQLDDLILGLTE
jgi:oxygen-independent coproporphyrinogen-3 oxidase